MLRIVVVLLAALVALPAHAQRDPGAAEADEQRFAIQSLSSSLAGIRLGRLALQKSFAAEVRSVARRMVDDFALVSQQLRAVAEDRGFELPEEPPTEAIVRAQQLTNLSGDDFNRAFMTYAVRYHSELVALFRAEAETGQGPFQQFAEEYLPNLRQRLRIADSVARRQQTAQAPPVGQQLRPATPVPQPETVPRTPERRQRPAVLVPYPIPQ